MNPLLKMAVINGSTTAVSLHLQREGDLDALDRSGMSLLMLAASRGHSETCRLILDAGADPTLRNAEGLSALCLARAEGHTEAADVIATFCRDERADAAAGSPGIDAGETLAEEDIFLSEWEAEPDPVEPDNDEEVFSKAGALNELLSSHVPATTDETWSDMAVELPDLDLAFLEDYLIPDYQPVEKKLLLHGIKTGRVALPQIDDMVELAGEEDGYAERLQEVLHDLGVRIDGLADDYVHPSLFDEVASEEFPEADEAIALLRERENQGNDPYRIFMRDVRRHPLLTAGEELAFGRMADEGRRAILEGSVLFPPALAELLAIPSRLTHISGSHDDEQANPDEDADTGDDGAEVQGEMDDSSLSGDEQPRRQLRMTTLRDLHAALVEMQLSGAPTEERSRVQELIRAELAEMAPSSHELLGIADFMTEQHDRISSGSREEREHPTGMLLADVPELCERVRSGGKKLRHAREVLTVHNLRLAHYIAGKYQNRGLPLADLVQEANVGLMKAVERFDYRRGLRFSTFATWWIRQTVLRAIADTARLIRIPVHVVETMNRIKTAERALEWRGPDAATPEKLAVEAKLPLVKVQRMLELSREPLSLDALEEDSPGYRETLRDDRAPDPQTELTASELRQAVRRALAELKPKYAQVVMLRYGIDMRMDHTLEEIASLTGLTRQRIAQIEVKGLGLLQKKKVLMEFRR
jgi:RNA polymerase primary sigma factor